VVAELRIRVNYMIILLLSIVTSDGERPVKSVKKATAIDHCHWTSMGIGGKGCNNGKDQKALSTKFGKKLAPSAKKA
jgi:hypothetical protein